MKKQFLMSRTTCFMLKRLIVISFFMLAPQASLLPVSNPYVKSAQQVQVSAYTASPASSSTSANPESHVLAPKKNKSMVLPAGYYTNNEKNMVAIPYQNATMHTGTVMLSDSSVNPYSPSNSSPGKQPYGVVTTDAKKHEVEPLLHPGMIVAPSPAPKQEEKKKEKKVEEPVKNISPKKYDFSQEFSLFAVQEAAQSPEISRLIQDSDVAIKKLQQDLEEKEKRLEELAEQKLDGLQEKVEQEILAMRKSAEKIAFDLKEDIKQEALRLRQEAARKTFGIITQAEEEAFTLKREARLKDFEDKFGKIIEPQQTRFTRRVEKKHRYRPLAKESEFQKGDASNVVVSVDRGGERVTPEWKNDISRKFYSDMTYMKRIILDGESPNEVHDFSQRFAEQNKWFDQTMRAVKYVNDANYKKIMHKHRRLQEVVAAQKKADEALKKMSHGLGLAVHQESKVRLMVLYDLNSIMQRKSEGSGILTSLSTDEVNSIVKRTLEEFSAKFQERSGRFPDVKILDNKTTQVIPVMAQKLQEELDAVQGKLEEAEQKILQEQQKRKSLKLAAKQKLQEKAKDHLELEVQVQHAEQTKARALELAQVDREAKNALSKKLEQIDKENMMLEVNLRKTKNEAEFAKNAAVSQLQHEVAGKLEEKEKRNLELSSLLRRVTERADFFKKRAVDLVGEANLHHERAELAEREALEAKEVARKQLALREEAEAKSHIAQQLAQQTIDSINSYLHEQKGSLGQVKNDLKAREEKLAQAEKTLLHDRTVIKRERDELLVHKNLLSKEQGLLEELRKETKRLVESSMKMNDENMNEFLKLRKDSEFELRKIQEDMKRELHFVREEVRRIKNEGREELAYARNKLDSINADIKNALHEQNLLSIQKQLHDKEEEDERSHEPEKEANTAVSPKVAAGNKRQQTAVAGKKNIPAMPGVQQKEKSSLMPQVLPQKVAHQRRGMPGITMQEKRVSGKVMPGVDPQKL